MKLKNVKIENYRSIGTVDLPIEDDLTTLVGANEHGKTNLLRAIQLLDLTTAITESDKRVPKSTDPIEDTKVSFVLELSDEEWIKAYDSTPENIEGKDGEEGHQSYQIFDSINLEISYNDGATNKYSITNCISSQDWQDVFISFIIESLKNKILFFDAFDDRLQPRIARDEVVSKNRDITNGLIELAELTGKESLIFSDTPRARQILEEGARKLTDQIKNIWIQGSEDNIQIKLSVSNDVGFLNVDIEDFSTYGDASTRSRGFLFFISFILKFKKYHDGEFKDSIFLIDEPGIFLHPRGQKDLLSYMENLSKHNQLIYTTHSPFMINRLNNFRTRVVSKAKDIGTQVDVKPYNNNWKALRASLGMMLADSFYYADNNLIVEGTSDFLYLLTLLKLFHEKEIIKLDINILSIIDSGGGPNIPAMVKIVQSEQRPLIVLLDSDDEGNRAKKSILKKGIKSTQIKQVSDFNSDAVTTEDLLPRKYLNMAVNACIAELVDEEVCNQPNQNFDSDVRSNIVSEWEKYLSVNECGIDQFSKLNVARNFDEVISKIPNEEFEQSDFDDAEKMVKWISKELNIKI